MENYSFLLLLFFVVLAFGVLASILRSFNDDRQDRNRYRTDATNPYGEQQPYQQYQGPPIIINTVPFQQYPQQYPPNRPFMSPVLMVLAIMGLGVYYFSNKNGINKTGSQIETNPAPVPPKAPGIDDIIAPNTTPGKTTYSAPVPAPKPAPKAQSGIHDLVKLGTFAEKENALIAYNKSQEVLTELSDYPFHCSITSEGRYMVFIKTASLEDSNKVLRAVGIHEKELNSYFNNTPPEIMHI